MIPTKGSNRKSRAEPLTSKRIHPVFQSRQSQRKLEKKPQHIYQGSIYASSGQLSGNSTKANIL